MKKTLALLFVLGFVSASYLRVIEPVPQTIDGGGELDLGVMGPGQKLELVANRGTGVTAAGWSGGEARWDQIGFTTLSPGWSSEDSKVYEQPMRAYLEADRNAADGVYYAELTAWDEYEGAPTTKFRIKVEIRSDLLGSELLTPNVVAGANQPARFQFILKNDSNAGDAYEILVSGLPGQWPAKKVFVPYHSTKTVSYEVGSSERGDYAVNFSITSISSEKIKSENAGKLSVRTNLFLDMLATSHGVLLFPSIEQPIYSLLGLFANFK
ncbi:hypothetical protein COX85_00765 [Candidatus Micrarchaeota archaeon CG_4_10_14_0_2_um_filter_55_9]|nr:MAG: hypothetical protein AUJ15_04050 [Candidatus Micrarchaeota archaeon CG1_02_55_41]PIO02951.1 MAG: hypothetical protein COT57_01445 [Candidatus Micrarchaeota archaeon CG09_land_8_20_14_0_10_55_25]PIZ92006.1 MAG: hypothetical protein COX85_00765 [Candidatus Micrarchaeota archaeon CG_4_10_14_0_2_um_filter_55_9]PJD01328.1 MAG: hypothetical protein COU38_01620 [Candidatus Micrarchaeota archaeon CG10_big_fil_rev_8_21_14_0_10_54_18]